MAGISQTGLYLSMIDPAGKKSQASYTKSRTSEEVIIDQIREDNPESADALQKYVNESKNIIASLKSSKSDTAQSKKAAAAEKIKRIKAEIQMLKAMGGDPKLMARRIARLARELAMAVREYASAGTTPSPSGDNAATGSGGNVGVSGTSANGPADPQADAAPTITAISGSADASAPAVNDQKDEYATPESEPSQATTAGPAMAEGIRQYSEMQQKFKDDVQRAVGKIKEQAAQTKADQEFALEARTQAALLKSLARQIKQRLNRGKDHSADADLEQTRKALAEVEKSLSEMTGNLHLAV